MEFWLTLAGCLISIGTSLGYYRYQLKELKEQQEKQFENMREMNSDFNAHVRQSDLHWTPRERAELSKELESVGNDLKRLLVKTARLTSLAEKED